jgi:hypothetical protein
MRFVEASWNAESKDRLDHLCALSCSCAVDVRERNGGLPRIGLKRGAFTAAEWITRRSNRLSDEIARIASGSTQAMEGSLWQAKEAIEERRTQGKPPVAIETTNGFYLCLYRPEGSHASRPAYS